MCGSKPIFRNYYILNLHMKKHKPDNRLEVLLKKAGVKEG